MGTSRWPKRIGWVMLLAAIALGVMLGLSGRF